MSSQVEREADNVVANEVETAAEVVEVSGAVTADASDEAEGPAKARYDREHMSRIGKLGSQAVVKKYGLRFYSEIARRNRGRAKKRTTTTEPEQA